jgi:hypothetical protein
VWELHAIAITVIWSTVVAILSWCDNACFYKYNTFPYWGRFVSFLELWPTDRSLPTSAMYWVPPLIDVCLSTDPLTVTLPISDSRLIFWSTILSKAPAYLSNAPQAVPIGNFKSNFTTALIHSPIYIYIYQCFIAVSFKILRIMH